MPSQPQRVSASSLLLWRCRQNCSSWQAHPQANLHAVMTICYFCARCTYNCESSTKMLSTSTEQTTENITCCPPSKASYTWLVAPKPRRPTTWMLAPRSGNSTNNLWGSLLSSWRRVYLTSGNRGDMSKDKCSFPSLKSSLTRIRVILSKSVSPTTTILRRLRGNCCRKTLPYVMALPTFSSLSYPPPCRLKSMMAAVVRGTQGLSRRPITTSGFRSWPQTEGLVCTS